MPSDPNKPLLRLEPGNNSRRPTGNPRPIPQPNSFVVARQETNFGPKFDQLRKALSDQNPLELKTDPTALAPERLLVFEVRGTISDFSRAVSSIDGLELIDEEELEGDEGDEGDTEPVAYLLMPNVAALEQLESLWSRWLKGRLIRGETPWRKVFELLRDLRPWGPQDRIQISDRHTLELEIDGLAQDEKIRLEIELIFRGHATESVAIENSAIKAIISFGGELVSKARIADIYYHALLIDVPVSAVREIIALNLDSIAGLEQVMYIRPQSLATTSNVADETEAGEYIPGNLGDPILAILDGVPLSAHPLLSQHIIVNDMFNLEGEALVKDRRHGTAMASLIIHGDRNRSEHPLPRKIVSIPVMGAEDRFPHNRLIVDLIYLAINELRNTEDPTTNNIIIVNISLGNKRRQFYHSPSAWARLLDRLAYKLGVLFIVSAGNIDADFEVDAYQTRIAFEDAESIPRSQNILSSIHNIIADRRLLSPAETINGVTVGGYNKDDVDRAINPAPLTNIEPYPVYDMSNPSSALGPGFARSVKPDILMPGAKERLLVVNNHHNIHVRPISGSRAAGLKVAAPPTDGIENSEAYTSGTSAAAALASRTCHRIYDALASFYGDQFTGLSHIQRAVLLKALLIHPAAWPADTADLIRTVLGPTDNRQHKKQKDNIRRFLGFGIVDSDTAIACAEDRATFWATGSLNADSQVEIAVPVPQLLNGQAKLHSLSATLAWFTPTSPGRRSYRNCRLHILEPEGLGNLALESSKTQPDRDQSKRGTVFSRTWLGEKAPTVQQNGTITLTVQRTPDQGTIIDDPIYFGLAVSIAMPGVVGLYDQVRERLQAEAQATTQTGIQL